VNLLSVGLETFLGLSIQGIIESQLDLTNIDDVRDKLIK